MKMELNLILNQSNSLFFGNFIRTRGFKNLKNWFQRLDQRFHWKKKVTTKMKGSL
jgi:hypothetical protein